MGSNDGITHAACNTYARRKFFEARDNRPQVASVLLAMFQELYDIEARALGLDAMSRLSLFQQESAAVRLRMGEYLDGEIVKKLLPKDPMSPAIGCNRLNSANNLKRPGSPVDITVNQAITRTSEKF